MSQENNEENKKKNESTVIFENISGYIKTVTTIPAYSPKNINQGVRIYMDSISSPTTKRLYIYSFEAKIWNYLTLT